MSAEVMKEIKLEIGHVLFMDIVDYSTRLIDEQLALRDALNQIVRSTEQFRDADAAGTLIKSPTGDGMALVSRGSLEEPVECAVGISRALKTHPELPLRIGVNSGPVTAVVDVNDTTSVAGAGINMAQRVMDCGDAGHILLSRHIAEDLEQYAHWQPHLHDLGECEVKHGVRASVVNLYTEELGNPELPEKFKQLRGKKRISAAVSKSMGKAMRQNSALLIAALLVAGALVAAMMIFWHRPSTKSANVFPSAAILEKSVAVLPFENLSRDPDNAYFATGIQDEILTRLAKISALRVISRSSTQQYAAKPGNLSEIARQLNVANILEGSVQRAGDRVHINAQLIRAATDEHLWAESYDRKLENIFSVEAEVATAVAEALRAKLTGAEQQALEQKPTGNPVAYDAYLRGIALWRTYYLGLLGNLQRLSGNVAAATISYSQARDELEQALKEQPPDAFWIYQGLAVAYAGLGDGKRALTLIDHALNLGAASRDATFVASCEETHARIAARFGQKEIAIPILERLLHTAYGDPITPALLRLDPDFDPLRGDPRFEKLAASDAPKDAKP